MAIKLNPGRQYPLVLEQAFTANDLDGTNAVVAAKLPRDAIILRGYISVTKAFSAGTIGVGVAGAATAYGSLNTATLGIKALTATGTPVGASELKLTPSAALTGGGATLVVEYIIAGRANEAQP